jgi:hypothetical protein
MCVDPPILLGSETIGRPKKKLRKARRAPIKPEIAVHHFRIAAIIF